MIGTQELIVIFLIVFVLFGGKRIPEIMVALGQGIRSFKKAMEEEVAPEPPKPALAKDSASVPFKHSPPSEGGLREKLTGERGRNAGLHETATAKDTCIGALRCSLE